VATCTTRLHSDDRAAYTTLHAEKRYDFKEEEKDRQGNQEPATA
jgi:hypothetical protein